MQFLVTLIALAALATATPTRKGCEPGTYDCLDGDKEGWQVCDVTGVWKFGGNCPPKTVCKLNEENDSPYCVPPRFHFP